jgi:hypothetical protein
VRSEDLDEQGQHDWGCNNIEPSGVELIEWTNKGVVGPVLLYLPMMIKEASVRELNQNCCVEEC